VSPEGLEVMNQSSSMEWREVPWIVVYTESTKCRAQTWMGKPLVELAEHQAAARGGGQRSSWTGEPSRKDRRL
jgi:hypothetical protein